MSNGASSPSDKEQTETGRNDAALGLIRESLSLAAILLASLLVAAGERLDYVPGSPYVSMIVLLALSVWYWRRNSVPVSVFPQRSGVWTLRLTFCFGLVTFLLISAWRPLGLLSAQRPTVLQVAHLLVLVPVVEEIYFRGLLLEHLNRGFGSIRAVLLSSLLFAVLHQPWSATVSTGILAIVACLLVFKGGALVYAIQLHVFWNALSLIHRTGDLAWRWRCAVFASAVVLVLGCALRRKQGGHETRDEPN